MRNSALIFVLAMVALVLAAGAEELLPKFFGVGFPVLLAAVQFMAVRRRFAVSAAIFALAAGATEDALSGLPIMTSASYFLMVAMLVRWSGFPRVALLLTYPSYQVWLAMWTTARGGEVFNRLWVSVPLGAVTALAIVFCLSWAEGKAGTDEQG